MKRHWKMKIQAFSKLVSENPSVAVAAVSYALLLATIIVINHTKNTSKPPPLPTVGSSVVKSRRFDSEPGNNLFSHIDASSDGKLSANEIKWALQRRVKFHMQKALRGNFRLFASFDKITMNGQVEWDEWFPLGLQTDLDPSSRTYKEMVAARKAAWKEAARSNPDRLNIDEFLSFVHPEFSHQQLLDEAGLVLDSLDSDGDEVLSPQEYLSRTLSQRRSLKEKTFRESDRNNDGSLTKSELFAAFDPKSEVWAMERANEIIFESDLNQNGLVDRDEFLLDNFEVLFPEKYFHPF